MEINKKNYYCKKCKTIHYWGTNFIRHYKFKRKFIRKDKGKKVKTKC